MSSAAPRAAVPWLALVGLLLWSAPACEPASPDDDSAGDDDTADDDTGDDDSAGDVALVVLSGEATVDGTGYAGTETHEVIAEQGQGDTLCAITYTWTSVAPRDDCAVCEWAWDLSASGAAVTAESGVGCAGVGADPAPFDGAQRAHGFAAEFIGHADVLMVPVAGEWEAVAYAGYNPKTGVLLYEWETGYQSLD